MRFLGTGLRGGLVRWLVSGLAGLGGCATRTTSGLGDGGAQPEAVAITTSAPQTATSGALVPIRCTLLDADGAAVPFPDGQAPAIAIADRQVVQATSGGYVAYKVGATAVTCSFGDLVDAAPPTITVTPGAPALVTTQVSRNMVVAGDAGTDVTCTVTDAAGNLVTGVTPAITLGTPGSGSVDGTNVVLTQAGDQRVGCVVPNVDTNWANVVVSAAAPTSIALSVLPSQSVFPVGTTVTITAAVTDAYGNPTDATGLTMVSSPAASATPGTGRFTYNSAGNYTVTATLPSGSGGAPLTGTATILISAGVPPIVCNPTEITIDGKTNTFAATHVSGNVTSPVGIASVTVEGKAVTLDAQGNFTTTVPSSFGANAFHVQATDSQGVVSERYCPFNAAQLYQPESTPAAGSVTLALGQPAVDEHASDGGAPAPNQLKSIGDVIWAGINATQLAGIIDAYLKTLPFTKSSGYYLGNGCVIPVVLCVDIYYWPTKQAVKLTSESIHPLLVSAGLRALVALAGLSLGIQSQGVLGLAASTGTVSVSDASAHADYTVSAPSKLLAATQLANTFSATESGVSVDTNNQLVDLVASLVPSLVTGILNDVFNDLITNVLNQILSNLTVSALGVGVTLPRLDGTGDVNISLSGSFSAANANATRLLTQLAPVFTITGGTVHSLSSAGVAVQGGSIAPLDPPLGGRGVGLALHSEAVNALVHQLWRNSYFTTALDAAALEKIGIDLSDLAPALAKNKVSLLAPLPPIVTVNGASGNLRIGIAGLQLTMVVPDAADPTPFALEVSAQLDAVPTLTGGKITVGSITTVSLNATLLSHPGGYDPTALAGLQALATQLVNAILGDVLGQSVIGIPIPQLNLPAKLGPISLPAPLTLGLAGPTLSESASYLVLTADLEQR